MPRPHPARLRMPESNLHFPKADVGPYVASWATARCAVMQGGQGDIKHWACKDPLGQRLTALMISTRIIDSAVPMSLLADHPNVQFNYFRGGLGGCAVEMH